MVLTPACSIDEPRMLPRPCPCCGGSSRPSRAAVSRSTVPRPLRWRSGSIPHDAVADPPPHRRSPLRTALARQRSRLRRPTSLARGRTANPIPQRAIRSFKPLRTSKLQAKTDRIAARGLAFPTLTPPPNPHSPRCTVGAPHGDFVPWRFSDAGCPSAGIASPFRRPKTCTQPAARAAKKIAGSWPPGPDATRSHAP